MIKKGFLSVLTVLTFIMAHAQLAAPIGYGSSNSNFSQYMSRTHVRTGDNDASGKPAPINAFNNLPNTKGERFLFNTWVKGDSMIDAQGNKVESGAMLFNVDKMTGNLIVTQNKIDIMSVAPIGIQSFVLSDLNKSYPFHHVKAIDSLRFYLQLAGNSNSKYALYKQFKTSFKAADYFSSGIIESGNRYDEYLDQSIYFIVMPGGKTSKQVTLKPKSVKEVLNDEESRMNQYFDQHKNEDRDEAFLAGLITFLNQ